MLSAVLIAAVACETEHPPRATIQEQPDDAGAVTIPGATQEQPADPGTGATPDLTSGPIADAPPETSPDSTQGQPDDIYVPQEVLDLVESAGQLTTTQESSSAPQQVQTLPDEILHTMDGDFACTEARYSLTAVPDRFVALNPNADVLWPGALIQGKSLAGGVLDPIPVSRAPGTITLALSSGEGGPFFQTMENPSLSSATQVQNEILAGYKGGTPAKFSYAYESIYSIDQLGVFVGANVKGSSWAVAAALGINQTDAKSRFLIQFTQEYYTMAFDPPMGIAGTFAPTVKLSDIQPYVGPGNPPVYVASVTYGRIFYILFESNVSAHELSTSVSASFSALGTISVEASASTKAIDVVNEAKIKIYGVGGNAHDAIQAATGSSLADPTSPRTQQEILQQFLVKGANFGKENPGVPISYTVRNFSDASQVRLALTTEYTAKNCVPIEIGCDGVPGSTQQTDACGVCGGDGSSCRDCEATSVRHDESNDAFVVFYLPPGKPGQTKRFSDGYHTQYKFPLCRGISWTAINFECKKGAWALDGNQSFRPDAWCTGSHDDNTYEVRAGVR